MKIKQETVVSYSPITIILETKEEAIALLKSIQIVTSDELKPVCSDDKEVESTFDFGCSLFRALCGKDGIDEL